MRAVFVVLAAALLVNGCSDDKKPVGITSDAASEHNLKKDCADPKWQQQNQGLWYSLCRQPLRW